MFTKRTRSGEDQLDDALGLLTAAANGVLVAADTLAREKSDLEVRLQAVSISSERAKKVADNLSALLEL
jgi:hypothetical protein